MGGKTMGSKTITRKRSATENEEMTDRKAWTPPTLKELEITEGTMQGPGPILDLESTGAS